MANIVKKENMDRFDVAIVGAGALGIGTAYWISKLTKLKVLVIDENGEIGDGTSGRSSGMLQSPIFYDPSSPQRVFGHAVCSSRKFWRKFFSTMMKNVGTLEIALEDEMVPVIETHMKWNSTYCPDDNIKLLSAGELGSVEPGLRATSALLLNDDAAADFKSMIKLMAPRADVSYAMNSTVNRIRENSDKVTIEADGSSYEATFLLNASGPAALQLAHSMGIAKGFADLYVGSYYWQVNEQLFNHHIFVISKYGSKFPFLDPYLSVMYDGSREVGPSPFLIGTPTYKKYGSMIGALPHLASSPFTPKLKLLSDMEFMKIVFSIRNSLTQGGIVGRVKRFMPALDKLGNKRRAGKRSLIIGPRGLLSPSSLIGTDRTLHVLQYYEPGVTGTPAFSNAIARLIAERLGIRISQSEGIDELPLEELRPLFITRL